MSGLMSAIATVIGLAVTGGFGWLTAKVTARAQTKQTEATARGPEWESFVDAMKDWTNKQLAERDKEISELKGNLTRLEERLDDLQSRYWLAIHHIRDWRLHHPDDILEPPAPIADDIAD